MRDRLTKAQVLTLFASVDAPIERLVDAIGDALDALYGPGSVDAHLRARGRGSVADAIADGDEDAVFALAVELNELRHLPADDEPSRPPDAHRHRPPPR